MTDKPFDTSLLFEILACLVLVGIVIFLIFRFFVRSHEIKDLIEEGCAVRENGLEIFGYMALGKKLIPYDQIESVELLSYLKAVGRMLLSNLSSRHFFRRVSSAVVHVKLRGPQRYTELFIANLFFTPKDPVALANQLNSRISGRTVTQTK